MIAAAETANMSAALLFLLKLTVTKVAASDNLWRLVLSTTIAALAAVGNST